MSEYTKQTITYESIKNELLMLAKADIRANTVLLIALLVVFVPLMFIGIYILKYVMVLGIISIVVFMVSPIVFICKVIKNIWDFYSVKKGGFSVEKDRVHSLSPGELISKNRTGDVIYFHEHGKYVPDKTVFELTARGDEFFIVVVNNDKKRPVFAYPVKCYNYIG